MLPKGTQCNKMDAVKYFNWDDTKNEKLKKERDISFEEIVFYIEKGRVLDIIENPNDRKYLDQLMYVVQVNDYVYLVPFVENENEIFLKTIIPSRKATRIYLRKD